MQYSQFCHFVIKGIQCIPCEVQKVSSVSYPPPPPSPPAHPHPLRMLFAEGLVGQNPSSHSPLSLCRCQVMSDPAGTGKSTYINKHLVQGLPKESWAPIFITFSARTTANMAQEQVCVPPPLSLQQLETCPNALTACCVGRFKTQAMNPGKAFMCGHFSACK